MKFSSKWLREGGGDCKIWRSHTYSDLSLEVLRYHTSLPKNKQTDNRRDFLPNCRFSDSVIPWSPQYARSHVSSWKAISISMEYLAATNQGVHMMFVCTVPTRNIFQLLAPNRHALSATVQHVRRHLGVYQAWRCSSMHCWKWVFRGWMWCPREKFLPFCWNSNPGCLARNQSTNWTKPYHACTWHEIFILLNSKIITELFCNLINV